MKTCTFIENLDKNYHSKKPDLAVSLSGGQKLLSGKLEFVRNPEWLLPWFAEELILDEDCDGKHDHSLD